MTESWLEFGHSGNALFEVETVHIELKTKGYYEKKFERDKLDYEPDKFNTSINIDRDDKDRKRLNLVWEAAWDSAYAHISETWNIGPEFAEGATKEGIRVIVFPNYVMIRWFTTSKERGYETEKLEAEFTIPLDAIMAIMVNHEW